MLEELAHYYKHSDGYLRHLEAKSADYFSKYVAAVCSLSGSSDRILDLGCGSAISTKAIASCGRTVVGSDLSPLFLSAARDSFGAIPDLIASNAGRLPFRDGTFDVVGAMEFIEHVWPVEAVLQEMVRILKPSGKIVLASPNLLSPLWPFRDLPVMLIHGRFRPPHYRNFKEALKYVHTSTLASLSKYLSRKAHFLPRLPDLHQADAGGDFDAVYYCHPRDLELFFRNCGLETFYATATDISRKGATKLKVASILGGLWGSFVLVARSPRGSQI